MLSGLLIVALLGAVVPVGYSGELGLSVSFTPPSPHFRVAAQPQSGLVRLMPQVPGGEHDYIDDRDNSDESSSANERMAEFCGSLRRSARSMFRTRLQLTAYTSHGALLPLFYAFCTLLI